MQALREGDGAKARELCAQAVLAEPTSPAALYTMAVYYELTHQPDRMARWLDVCIEAQPDHADAWVLKSKHLENSGFLNSALRGYEHALSIEPGHPPAASKRDALLWHQGVYIQPMNAWEDGAAWVIEEGAAGVGPRLPAWQENFLQPEHGTELRQPLLSGGVMAWDNVLNQGLLDELDRCVTDYQRFTFSNGRVYAEDEGDAAGAATVWLPADTPPATAPELAARCILQNIVREDVNDFAGVEFWGRVRSVNLGAGLHYDEVLGARDDEEGANPWRPQWSSVLYLTDEGGPTVILDQIHCLEGRHVPPVPQRGHLCMPKRNRLVVFRADLFHGTLPQDIWLDSAETRRVFVFNFWRRHRPDELQCRRPDYSRHVAMRQLQLQPAQLQELQAQESQLYGGPRAVPVERQTFARPDDLPHSSDLGYLQMDLPMPSMGQLRDSAGFCELDWAAAATLNLGQALDGAAVDK